MNAVKFFLMALVAANVLTTVPARAEDRVSWEQELFESMAPGEEIGNCTADYPTSACSFVELRSNEAYQCLRQRDENYREGTSTTKYECAVIEK